MNNSFSILINSTDRYSDCWDPLFTLVQKYWKNADAKIYLNCEHKNYSFDGLDINLIRNSDDFTWSQCLINALNNIDSPVVLYLQDDYFIDSEVDIKSIKEFAELMIKNPEIKTIGLTKFGSPATEISYAKDDRLKIVKKFAKYRISLQAGLWNKECLLSYLLEDENAWMFEIFGSGRARKRNDLFLTISPEYYKEKAIINYLHTGIIKGKWHKDIPAFFAIEKINVDFSIRGTIDPFENRLRNKSQTIRKLLSHPSKFKYLLP